jgi:hypothetical protein
MCVAIPLGRRPDGVPGTRLGRYLRTRPWRFTAAVPLLLALLLGFMLTGRPLDLGTPLALILAQALVAAPLLGALMTRLPEATRTSPPGHLWFAGFAGVSLVGGAGCALGAAQGTGWAVPSLLALAWAWWLAAAAMRWHPGWSRLRVARTTLLLPAAAYGGALVLDLAALAALLGQGGALRALAWTGVALTALAAACALAMAQRRTSHPSRAGPPYLANGHA